MIWKRIKRWLKLIGITLAVMAVPFGILVWWQWDAVSGYTRARIFEYKAGALTKAMERQVKSLPEVDSVKLLRLSETAVAHGQAPFGQGFHGGKLYAVQTKDLSGPSARQFATLWRKQSVSENFVMCHDPHHAVFFYDQGKEVGRATICFHCTNAAIPANIFGDDLIEFDSSTVEYTELKYFVESLVGADKEP